MKIGEREIERIIVERKDGEFLAEIMDGTIETDSDIRVTLVGKYDTVSTYELTMELLNRGTVDVVMQDNDEIILRVKK